MFPGMEPTPAMIRAGADAMNCITADNKAEAEKVWKAMYHVWVRQQEKAAKRHA